MSTLPATLDSAPCHDGEPLALASVDAQTLDRYALDGYVVIPRALTPEAVSALAAETLGVLRARNVPDSFLAQSSEYRRGSWLDRLMHSPRLLAIASALLGGQAHLYLPFTAVKGPRQGRFTFHQDNSYTRHDGPSTNCWFALEDITLARGCLRMVRGSHRDGTLPAEASSECAGHRQVAEPAAWDDIELRAGDCVAFSRLTVHGSGPNTTHRPRVAYAVQFHRADTLAFFDGSWELLSARPRWTDRAVDTFSDRADAEV